MFVPPQFADRLSWAAVAAPVRDAIEQFLGAPVVAASTRVGGFSPGFAGVVTASSGRTVFVKAISTAQNPTTPSMLRTERQVAAAMPADPNVPALKWSVDEQVDGENWVALVFEAVSGTSPHLPWTAPDARDALTALTALSARLTPCSPELPTLVEVATSLVDGWWHAAEADSPVLTTQVRGQLPELVELARRGGDADGPLAGDTMLHLDLRADNLLIDRSAASPHVWFVDWPWACAGPAWVDAAVLALDFAAYGGHLPEELLAEADVSCPADGLPVLLGCLAGEWARSLSTPAVPGMSGLRAFQRRFFDASMAWLERATA